MLRKGAGLLIALSIAGCAGGRPPPATAPPVEPVGPGWSETGIASWYGEPFHGRRTASGEVYDMDAMTAAHPWLPFGTRVRVDNRDNGRAAELRINDRGPFVDGRIIDLSRSVARRLGMIGPGTARVRVTVLETGGDPVSLRGGCAELQVGAFRDAGRAAALDRRVRASGFRSRVDTSSDGLRRVIAGPFRTAAEAAAAEGRHGGFYRPCDAGL